MSLSDSEYLWLETTSTHSWCMSVHYCVSSYCICMRYCLFFLAFLWYSRYWWDSVFFFLFPALNPVMNGNLNGSILEINVNLFSFSLTVPQDTGIVTTATLCYLFSNHASAYFLSLYTFYYFIFITDMFLFIHDCCFRHKSHDRCYCPLEMI